MATVQAPAMPTVHRGVEPLRAGQGLSFLWRKLHSLSGIVPIGAFFIEHLFSNSDALKGPVAYVAGRMPPDLWATSSCTFRSGRVVGNTAVTSSLFLDYR